MSEASDADDRSRGIVHPTPAGGPSLRIVAVSDPGSEASAYAQRLGADVGADRPTVLAHLQARTEAARLLRDEPEDPDAADLLARADSIRAAATAPDIGEADLARLQRLADELARAGRIRAHTERRVDERRQAERAAVAPRASVETVFEAAAVVVEAEAALDRAEEAVAAADLAPLPFDADRPGAAAAAVRPTGLLARIRESLATQRDEHTVGRLGDDAQARPDDELAAARERVRAAWDQWRRVAGPDADPYAPEAALPSDDPQLPYDEGDPTPPATLLAVAAFHRKVQARWRVLWASVGGGEPPEPEQLDVALEGLAGRRRRAGSEVVRLERAERRAAAAAVVARPLVVVQPGSWTTAEELRRLLGPLPAEAQVIVLERRGPGATA